VFNKEVDNTVHASHGKLRPVVYFLGDWIMWQDLKIGYEILDVDRLWAADQDGSLKLPPGWKLIETDGSCFQLWAVFRVEHLPTATEALLVGKALAKNRNLKPDAAAA
jgi:hypothetical protein